jgi:hypothetical protein
LVLHPNEIGDALTHVIADGWEMRADYNHNTPGNPPARVNRRGTGDDLGGSVTSEQGEDVEFAKALMLHAQTEAEMSYPTAMQIGAYLREKLRLS